ncbi:MAG: Holliday junction resolvase RuvX [Acidimicrobiales bacterium]
MRVLGVDPGTKRIGLALGDTATRVATPLTVVIRTGDGAGSRREVAGIVDEWEVEALVVGLPITMAGEHGTAAAAAETEADALAAATHVPVTLYDERLTTVTAHRSLQDQGLDSRARRERVDAVAAAVMLQAWLDGVAAGTITVPGEGIVSKTSSGAPEPATGKSPTS